MFRASSCPSSGEWYKTDKTYGVQHWLCCSRLVEKRRFGVHLLGLVSRLYWILGSKPELSIEEKLLIYRTILKLIWTYGIPLWGTASNSNIEILQRYQNKVLRAIVNAPWYISNKVTGADLKIPAIREEVTKFSIKYRDKITTTQKNLHPHYY
jgi:hypothetical protein